MMSQRDFTPPVDHCVWIEKVYKDGSGKGLWLTVMMYWPLKSPFGEHIRQDTR